MTKLISLTIFCYTLILCTTVHAQQWRCPDSGLFLSGDLLYWKGKQHGLDFSTKPLPVFTTTDFTDTHLVAPDFEWEAGFRLTAGYEFSGTHWSAALRYTRYTESAHGTQSAGDTEGIFPTLSFSPNTLPTDYVTFAKMHWKLETNIIDIISEYQWCINKCLSLTTILSIRNAWISQHITADYRGGTFIAGKDTVSLHSNFYGVGPRIGFKPTVSLGSGFSIYGEASGSVLYSWYHVHQKETFLSTSLASLHKKPQGIRWNGDLIAGLNWTYCADACCAIKQYSIDIGFDWTYFSKQYTFEHGSSFTLPGKSKYLMLEGIHLSAGLQF